jgi:hypothetical protein
MKTFRVPKFLHDVLGEEQGVLEIILILAVSVVLGMILLFTAFDIFTRVSLWRSILAIVLSIDIYAGCIANFTRGTNNYYATRTKNRILFIAIHVHLLLIMSLLAEPIFPYFIIWAYTISGAFVVNGLKKTKYQKFIGGALLTIGLSAMSLLPGISPWGITISAPFMIKVLYSFAVDHYADSEVHGQ